MRKLILCVGLITILGVSVCLSNEVNVKTTIPNLEASFLVDFSNGNVSSGMTSKFLSIADFWDVRVGYSTPQNLVLGLSFDLKKLQKLGLKVNYLWENTNIVLGGWVGHNFNTNKTSYGALLVLVQIELSK